MSAFSRKRVDRLLSQIGIDRVVGASGLAVLCAASFLAFAPSPGPELIAALTAYMSGLGLNVLAGILHSNYQDLLSQPTADEKNRLSELASSISADIKREAKLRKEIGRFLGSLDAFRIAEEVTKGNPAIHGWLLVELYKDVTQYRSDFDQIHLTLAEMYKVIQQIAKNSDSFDQLPKNIRNDELFEIDIAELYGAMGYEVEQQVSLSGQTVNILATRHIPGMGPLSLIVICKYKDGVGLVDDEDIRSAFAIFNVVNATNKILSCTIVTTNGFTSSAQEMASTLGLNLTTKKRLIAGLIDFSAYLRKLKSRFQGDFGKGDSSWYITTKIRSKQQGFETLDEYIDSWLTEKSKRPLDLCFKSF